jgi:VanZ family protein
VVKNYWLAILWTIGIIVLSTMPPDDIPETKLSLIPHFDKVVHFLMYAGLTFLILRKNSVYFKNKNQSIVLFFSILFCFLTGFLLEIIQNSFIIGRIFDIFDVLANTIGIISAVVLTKMFNH